METFTSMEIILAYNHIATYMLRSSAPLVFLWKHFLKKCRKFTGEHPCRSVISIKMQSNVIETTLRNGCSPVNLLHIFRAPFTENISVETFLYVYEEDFGIHISEITLKYNANIFTQNISWHSLSVAQKYDLFSRNHYYFL